MGRASSGRCATSVWPVAIAEPLRPRPQVWLLCCELRGRPMPGGGAADSGGALAVAVDLRRNFLRGQLPLTYIGEASWCLHVTAPGPGTGPLPARDPTAGATAGMAVRAGPPPLAARLAAAAAALRDTLTALRQLPHEPGSRAAQCGPGGDGKPAAKGGDAAEACGGAGPQLLRLISEQLEQPLRWAARRARGAERAGCRARGLTPRCRAARAPAPRRRCWGGWRWRRTPWSRPGPSPTHTRTSDLG
jgi:hypothetical protein